MQNKSHFLKNPIDILYEDSNYIVFYKPAGLLVIPTPKKEKNTLENIVNYQCLKNSENERLYPCHRLDRDTSGAIIFAKSKRYQKKMMDEFAKKQVIKKYTALVFGRMNKPQGEFKGYIVKKEDQMRSGKKSGKPAITKYKVVEEKKYFSIVEIQTITGRTNQIRIHFSKNKHPLVGDRKFAVQKSYPIKFKRAALHASYLEFVNPITDKRIKVKSRLPKDMEDLIGRY